MVHYYPRRHSQDPTTWQQGITFARGWHYLIPKASCIFKCFRIPALSETVTHNSCPDSVTRSDSLRLLGA